MRSILYIVIFSIFLSACYRHEHIVTLNELLDELVNLDRLATFSGQNYRTVQFSSYDRRSTTPSDTTWFANEDGFGGEPVPGFVKILRQPDSSGIGEYLICDIQNPGVIQRLWTAAISGRVRLFLDDTLTPVYEGNASDFFRKPLEALTGIGDAEKYEKTIHQFDATYLPVPFASRCRIEWTGNIEEPHFYHVGIRLYDPDIRVEPFSADRSGKYIQKLEEVNSLLIRPDSLIWPEKTTIQKSEIMIEANAAKDIFHLEGNKAVKYFALKVSAADLETVLRQVVLNIYFDEAEVPQVQSPVGDFFGAAPGLNPFESLPFSVRADTTLICRFVMPFKSSARMEMINFSSEDISILAEIKTAPYRWKEGLSMYFRARWKISHEITAQNTDSRAMDISYLKAAGAGRVVGVAAYIYNPSNAPTSWGNWWGEGDEKIFIDRDTFPSYFGTGSEDYFNYSWSSPEIFCYPYCGQPRNDGPGNRGYVSNFRWYIADEIPFREKIDFYMELRHHGVIPGFTYGRIVYFYGLPLLTDDYQKIGTGDICELQYLPWSPQAYLGSAGYTFIQAEKLAAGEHLHVKEGKMWAERSILSWTPEATSEKITINFRTGTGSAKTRIGLTVAHEAGGGTLSFMLNGRPITFDDRETLSLSWPGRTILANHFSEQVALKKGCNEFIMRMPDADGRKTASIDFIWIRE